MLHLVWDTLYIGGNRESHVEKFLPWEGDLSKRCDCDCARAHTTDDIKLFMNNGSCKIVHPIYLPHIPASIFCFVGTLKRQLIRQSAQDEQKVLDEIIQMEGAIRTLEFWRAFETWISRVEEHIQM
jgi:hypothetical protein